MIHGIMASVAGGGGGGGPSAYYTQESLAGQTEAAGTLTTLLTMNRLAADFTPSATYLGIYSLDAANDNAAGGVVCQVLAGATTVFSRTFNCATATPNEKLGIGGLFLFAPGGSPANTDFVIKGNRNSAGTATFSNARLSLLKLGAGDFTRENLAGGTMTSSTLTTVDTFTFTPGSAGNYIVLCYFEISGSSVANSYMAEVSDGTTTVGQNNPGPLNATGQIAGQCVAIPISGASGLQTLTLKVRSVNNSATLTYQNIRWVAIREDRFANVYKSRLASDNSGTDTSYTTALTQTFTPAAADHLTIATYGSFNSSATTSTYSKFVDGGADLNEQVLDMGRNNESLGIMPALSHRIAAFAASSRTQSIQRQAEANTAGIRAGASIVTLDLAGIT